MKSSYHSHPYQYPHSHLLMSSSTLNGSAPPSSVQFLSPFNQILCAFSLIIRAIFHFLPFCHTFSVSYFCDMIVIITNTPVNPVETSTNPRTPQIFMHKFSLFLYHLAFSFILLQSDFGLMLLLLHSVFVQSLIITRVVFRAQNVVAFGGYEKENERCEVDDWAKLQASRRKC